MAEILEYKSKQDSAYLWKPHADALTWLMTAAQTAEQQCTEVLKTAEQRGLGEKVSVLTASLHKLKTQVQLAAQALQANGS